jgi:excisionase family DNA binding protein
MSITSTGLSRSERRRAVEPLGVPPGDAWIMLGVSNSKGYELLAKGELDSYMVGRARRITVASIHRLIERLLCDGTSPPGVIGRRIGAPRVLTP